MFLLPPGEGGAKRRMRVCPGRLSASLLKNEPQRVNEVNSRWFAFMARCGSSIISVSDELRRRPQPLSRRERGSSAGAHCNGPM